MSTRPLDTDTDRHRHRLSVGPGATGGYLHRVLAVAGLLAAVGLLMAGSPVPPAGAHEGTAVITIEGVHPAGTQVHYVVRVTWENDGHAAADATVTATAVAGSGEQLTPVTLTPVDSDGRYEGIVEYPSAGSWTVRITSIDPTGTLEQPQEVTASPSTLPAEAGGEVTTGTAQPEGDGDGFAAADDGTGGSTDGQAAADQNDDGGMPIWLIVAAAAVVIVGAVTGVGIVRRYRANPPDPPITEN
jgi:hypothetical protein